MSKAGRLAAWSSVQLCLLCFVPSAGAGMSASPADAKDVPTISVTVLPRSYGLLSMFVTDVTSSSPSLPQPTGTVTYSEGTATLGIVGIDLNGEASLSINSLDAGAHTVTITYNGDDKYSSTSTSAQLVVPQRATSLRLTPSVSSPAVGEPFTLKAALSRASMVRIDAVPQGPLPPVVGNVTFRDGATVLGIVPIPYGSTTLAVSSLARGVHELSARYEGSNNYGPSEDLLSLEVVESDAGADGGPDGAEAPDATKDVGDDEPSVVDGQPPTAETGADVASMDMAIFDSAVGDITTDAVDVAIADAHNAGDAISADDIANVDGLGDAIGDADTAVDADADDVSAPPPPVSDDGSVQTGCGCSLAAPWSGEVQVGAVGWALGFLVIRRRRWRRSRSDCPPPLTHRRKDHKQSRNTWSR